MAVLALSIDARDDARRILDAAARRLLAEQQAGEDEAQVANREPANGGRAVTVRGRLS